MPAVFKKARAGLLGALRDGSLDRIVVDMERQREEEAQIVAEEFAGLEGMELSIEEFIAAFRTSPQLIRKVAVSTGIDEADLKQLQDAELDGLFKAMDTDYSGTISFDEFVKGIISIREQSMVAEAEAEQAEEEEVLDQAFVDACEAFQDANFQYQGELDLVTFTEALQDPFIVEKVVMATHLPSSFFESLTQASLQELFQQIDTDASGTVSFMEWVTALVKIRKDIYDQEKQEEEEALEEVLKHAEDALDEGDEDWSGEFDLNEFLSAFRDNPRFVRKVSLATNIPIAEFKGLCDEALENLFQTLDTDFSGTISFEEFVRGLVQIRLSRQAEIREEETAREEEALDEAYMEAVEAFNDADFQYSGELDLQAFMEALSDPVIVEKVAYATKLPPEFFDSLDAERMMALFQEIDSDASGTVSFVEWVNALVKIRQTTYQQEKIEHEETAAAIISIAEEALDEADEDWSGEFEFNEFITAFRENPRFLRKVSLATKVPVEDFQALGDWDLAELFESLDTDLSGTVSFDEFVTGLVEIREAREAELAAQDAEEEENAIDNAYLDAVDAFEDVDPELKGEVDFQGFSKAMQDSNFVEKVKIATKLSDDFFSGLEGDRLVDLFAEIDTDASGTISFDEWVRALVRIRVHTFRQEKAEEKQAYIEVLKSAETAFAEGDEDWSGEFDLQEFVKAFRTNPRFVHKVSAATNVPPMEWASVGTDDLAELFNALDTDFSGTLSFNEFVEGLVQIGLARKEELRAKDAETQRNIKKKKQKASVKPYVIPAEIQQLPQLSETEKARFADVFEKYNESNWGFDCCAANVAKMMQDLFLVVDQQAAQKYIDRAFPGRDLSVGLKQEDGEVLYRVALNAQPLWTKPLMKSASAATITVKDVLEQETAMREVFARRAGAGGTLKSQEVGNFLSDMGVMDGAAYTPRLLDTFHDKRKPGPVIFPEVVGLCNVAMSRALRHHRNPRPSQIKLEPLEPLDLPAVGSPAKSLRKKRLQRTDWAAQGKFVLAGVGGLRKSSSTSRLTCTGRSF
eukprot:gb/GFBE01003818.1/.p1 GENE.gb/GFBE01003818.1/~~gb/GFBE01003818.1/.p1  ORF type:complete len:1032 (+),score=325.18 gb/GFBE01003818.1/:1-3096(+)